jgi:hypothetical protein
MGSEVINPGENQPKLSQMPLLARVVGHGDSTNMGVIDVELLHDDSGDDNEKSPGQTIPVRMISPFWGNTPEEFSVTDPDDYNNTVKSYGMWFVPPDVGSIVLVIFINGNAGKGYWIGGVPTDEGRNFMVPGIAATEANVDSKSTRIPVAEYNKKIPNAGNLDANKLKKPRHVFTDVLESQGLINDDTRGITSSSARREVPSSVFGISTPGPRDKRPEDYKDGTNPKALRGKIGQAPNKKETWVSRLGGTSFVMDDGDDKFVRTDHAGKAPPTYVSFDDAESASGDVTIPHNELVRIRTRTGHQILLHNSEDLIYITNSRGTAWIELTSNGKIDIYAQDSISIHTANDLNIKADRDINLEAGRNFNLKADGYSSNEFGGDYHLSAKGLGQIAIDGTMDITYGDDTAMTVSGSFNLNTSTDNNFTAGGNTNINTGGNHVETADKIHMNGPAADKASKATKPDAIPTHKNPTDLSNTVDSILQRVPGTEPWPGHENLDPTFFTSDKTDINSQDDIGVPDAFETYTTPYDTFNPPPPKAEDYSQGP